MKNRILEDLEEYFIIELEDITEIEDLIAFKNNIKDFEKFKNKMNEMIDEKFYRLLMD